MDENQLIPTAQETWAGVKIVADAIITRFKGKSAARISGTDLKGPVNSKKT